MSTKPFSSYDKWTVSLMSGLLFLLISSPIMYYVTNGLVFPITGANTILNEAPTTVGLLIHAFIFLCIVRLMMK